MFAQIRNILLYHNDQKAFLVWQIYYSIINSETLLHINKFVIQEKPSTGRYDLIKLPKKHEAYRESSFIKTPKIRNNNQGPVAWNC